VRVQLSNLAAGMTILIAGSAEDETDAGFGRHLRAQ
jgi:hypothetical protein